jgi:hypothetical protein
MRESDEHKTHRNGKLQLLLSKLITHKIQQAKDHHAKYRCERRRSHEVAPSSPPPHHAERKRTQAQAGCRPATQRVRAQETLAASASISPSLIHIQLAGPVSPCTNTFPHRPLTSPGHPGGISLPPLSPGNTKPANGRHPWLDRGRHALTSTQQKQNESPPLSLLPPTPRQ